MRLTIGVMLLTLALNMFAQGDNALDSKIMDAAMKAKFKKDLEANVKRYKGNADVMVRMGVVADRKARTVRVLAVACGLKEVDPAEYVLVYETGKDYESVAVTAAKPSDVNDAMKFVGMIPGHPINPRKFQFWAKGDRVDVTFKWEEDGNKFAVAGEEMLWNPNTKKPLPRSGWMFTGSTTLQQNGKDVYVANQTGEIISTYNSPFTVFDVPGNASQAAVYGSIVSNPDYLMTFKSLIEIEIKPQLPKGKSRIVEYQMNIHQGKDGKTMEADKLLLDLVQISDKKKVLDKADFRTALTTLSKDVKANRDTYLQFSCDDSLTLQPIRHFYEVIRQAARLGIFRIEPKDGHPFYEAFLPAKEWRDYKKRMTQPIEIHFLNRDGGKKKLFQYYLEEIMDDGSSKYKLLRYVFSTEKGLKTILAKRKSWDTTTAMLFVKPTTTYGEAKKWHKLLYKDFPVQYFFDVDPMIETTIKTVKEE